MDLKRCRKLSKNRDLVYSSAAYIKLLDYAERLQAENQYYAARSEIQHKRIVEAIKAQRETRTRPRCGLSIGGKIFNSGLGAAIRAVDELQAVGDNGSE